MKKAIKKLAMLFAASLSGLLLFSNGSEVSAESSLSVNDWNTLKSNLRSSQAMEIKLSSDIDFTLVEVNSGLDLPSVVGDKILDLNGHNIHFTNESTLGGINGIFSIPEGSSLKIINSKSTDNSFTYTNNAVFGKKNYGAKDGAMNSEWIKTQGFIDVSGDLVVEGSNVTLEIDTKGYAISPKKNGNVTIDGASIRTYMGYAISVIDTISQTESPTITLDGNCTLGPRTKTHAGYATSQKNGNAFGAGAIMIRDTEGTTLNLFDATLCYGMENDMDSIYEDINQENYKITENGNFVEYDDEFKWSVDGLLHDSKYYYYSISSMNYNELVTRFQKYYFTQVSTISSYSYSNYTVSNDDSYTYKGVSESEWYKLYKKLAYGDTLTFTFNTSSKYDVVIENNSTGVEVFNEKINGSYTYEYKIGKEENNLYVTFTESDITAPTITNISASRVLGSSRTNVTFDYDEASTLYYGKTEAEVLAKTNKMTLSDPSKNAQFSFSGLDSKNVKLYFMVEDLDLNKTEVFTVNVPDQYEATLETPVNGTISIDNKKYTAGDHVYLSYRANSTYAIDHFVVTDSDDLNVEVLYDSTKGKYYFVAPESDVLINAIFKNASYQIAYNISSDLEELKNPSLYFKNVIDAADYGDEIVLYKTFDNYTFEAFKVFGVEYAEDDETISFTMPATTVFFVFKAYYEVSSVNVTLDAVSEETIITSATDSRVSIDNSALSIKSISTTVYDILADTSYYIPSTEVYINTNYYSSSISIQVPTGYKFADYVQYTVNDDASGEIETGGVRTISVIYIYQSEKKEYNVSFNSNFGSVDYRLYYLINDEKVYVDKVGYKCKVYIEVPGYLVTSGTSTTNNLTYPSSTKVYSGSTSSDKTNFSVTYSEARDGLITLKLIKKLDIELNNIEYQIQGNKNSSITTTDVLAMASPTENVATKVVYSWVKNASDSALDVELTSDDVYLIAKVYFDTTIYTITKDNILYINGVPYSLEDATFYSNSSYNQVKVGSFETLKEIEEIPSTCVTNGTSNYYVGNISGKNYFDVYKTEITDLDLWKETSGLLPLVEHTYGEYVQPVLPTCEDDGKLGYYYCSVCESYFDNEYNELSSRVVTKLGHDYGTIVYEWNADFTECVAKNICSHDETHVISENATITKTVVNPTCVLDGKTTLTATFEGEEFETQTKIITHVALNHDLTHYDELAPTCTEAGHNAYDSCSRCEYTTYEAIDALGHNFVYCEEVPSTQKAYGTKAHYECDRCNSLFDESKKLTTASNLRIGLLPIYFEIVAPEFVNYKVTISNKEITEYVGYNSNKVSVALDYDTTKYKIFANAIYEDGTPGSAVLINASNVATFALSRNVRIEFTAKINVYEINIDVHSIEVGDTINDKSDEYITVPEFMTYDSASIYDGSGSWVLTPGKVYSVRVMRFEIEDGYTLHPSFVAYVNGALAEYKSTISSIIYTFTCPELKSKASTCEESGISKYYEITTDGVTKYYTDFTCGNEIDLEEYSLGDGYIAPHGHEYINHSYNFSDDYKTCTAKAICKYDEEHVLTETVNTTFDYIDAPTCISAGTATYHAVFENSEFENQDTVGAVDALGHNFLEPTYVWDFEIMKCIGKRECANGIDHPIMETPTIVTSRVEATCEDDGLITHTATFTEPGFETQVKTEVIYALGHDYSDPTYSWNSDYTECVSTRVCRNDETHIITVNGTITSNMVNPTCLESGSITYVASFDGTEYETQTKIVPINALGHNSVTDLAVLPTYKTTGLTEGSHCDRCNMVLVAQEIVPVLECHHEHLTKVDEVSATKTTYGTKAYNKCNDCDKLFELDSTKEITNLDYWVNNEGRIEKLNDKSKSNGLGTGAIVGIVLVSVVAVSAIGAVSFIFIKKKKK